MQYRSNIINEYIKHGIFDDLILQSEAAHVLQIENLVRMIEYSDSYTKNKPITNGVFVTGPSSSGKTTTAGLIAKELERKGFRSIHISLDNYYLPHDEVCRVQGKPEGTPVTELDMENPNALNIELFKNQMNDLIEGHEILRPSYGFSNTEEVEGEHIKPTNDDVIIIEGIHALNPLISDGINFPKSFKVYISPFDNFIGPSGQLLLRPRDVRFMRRCTRDISERNMTIETEMDMWPKVREGEEKYIKTTKRYADFFFNSSLKYEVSVLKHRFMKIIKDIDENELARLKSIFPLDSLEWFVEVPNVKISENSIFNEFYKQDI